METKPQLKCCWCKGDGKGNIGRHKIKMTSGRIAKKVFHQECLNKMLNAKPTSKNARLV